MREIRPSRLLPYRDFTVTVPDDASMDYIVAFARQFTLWAEGLYEHQKRVERLNTAFQPAPPKDNGQTDNT